MNDAECAQARAEWQNYVEGEIEMRESVSVEQVANDPTNCYQITVHGDVAIKSLRIHDAETANPWVSIEYANGGSSSGTPAHWHSFVRIT